MKRERILKDLNLDEASIAVQGYSPVSYIEKGIAEMGSPEFAVTHNGATYYMTSAEQAERFRAEPERYLPEYGGWCAYGMAIGKKFPIDPKTFKLVDGRLMLFLNNGEVDALELWNKENEAKMTRKADRFWDSLEEEKAA